MLRALRERLAESRASVLLGLHQPESEAGGALLGRDGLRLLDLHRRPLALRLRARRRECRRAGRAPAGAAVARRHAFRRLARGPFSPGARDRRDQRRTERHHRRRGGRRLRRRPRGCGLRAGRTDGAAPVDVSPDPGRIAAAAGQIAGGADGGEPRPHDDRERRCLRRSRDRRPPARCRPAPTRSSRSPGSSFSWPPSCWWACARDPALRPSTSRAGSSGRRLQASAPCCTTRAFA